MGKYHPHGDQAIYNTMVGMVQDFVKRYPLHLKVKVTGVQLMATNAAAMRYTEVRMEKLLKIIKADIDKNTVQFVPNFDDSTVEPVILQVVSNLLVNGAAGIAVGMATSIPPHNLGEVVDACLALLCT